MTIPVLQGLDPSAGLVVHTSRQVREGVQERFTVVFDRPSVARVVENRSGSALVAVQPFATRPALEGSVLYLRPLGTSDREVALEWSRSVRPQGGEAVDKIDLRTVDPEPLESFWAMIDVLRGKATRSGMAELTRRLERCDLLEIAAFQSRLESLASALAGVVAGGVPEEDAALCLAIIARGEGAAVRSLTGHAPLVTGRELDAARELGNVAHVA